MKVLQINSVCGVGSTGRIAVDLYKTLEHRGYEGCIAYGRGIAPKGVNTIKIGNKVDLYHHVLKTRILDRHGFASTKATQEFVTKVKEYDPDIIHLHNIHGYYLNIEVLFKYIEEARKPVIWTLHDCWPFTGHCGYFDFVGCERWKSECHHCPNKRVYPESLILDNSIENYRKKKDLFTSYKNITFVTPSKWLAGLVKDSYFGSYDVKVIPNGINLDVFKPKKNDFKMRYQIENKFLILGVASVWDRRKGLDTFIQLSKELDSKYQVVIIGVTTKQKELLPDNIIGITRTDNVEELVSIYSAADVFVNPTLEDNFPTTNIEALACGTPVITYDTGGSPESIDSSCGMVVQKNSIERLIDSIKKIPEKQVIQDSCRKKAAEFDMWERFYDYIKLYEKFK
ncbi:glycosyl transferase [Pradoshia eiseniae]|uniref:Glycosyl transferase n=1 Tax=Pradoshia eiseniae TaxID=2064768 RepID=A0A2S7N2E1_9BACI|nr:glycosyltransferase [Pradoshia eiseniae]PQD96173.1 glycosyl transferase [Pradoshia eiseniae]